MHHTRHKHRVSRGSLRRTLFPVLVTEPSWVSASWSVYKRCGLIRDTGNGSAETPAAERFRRTNLAHWQNLRGTGIRADTPHREQGIGPSSLIS
jgi:hypothetical protein